MSAAEPDVGQRRGEYGIDGDFSVVSARWQAAILAVIWLGLVVWTVWNAEREGVSERVQLHTGDMRQLPFADGTFDVVISNLAVHNIASSDGRRAAIGEAVRVLRPQGKLAIVDLWATNRHASQLREAGMTDVRRRRVGWRMWWGGPWAPSHLVTATKNSGPPPAATGAS